MDYIQTTSILRNINWYLFTAIYCDLICVSICVQYMLSRINDT